MPTKVSLHRQLMRRLAVPLLFLLLMESLLSYGLAVHYSQSALDASLYESARSLAAQVKLVSGNATLILPREAVEIIQWDMLDRTYFSVNSRRRGALMGHPDLPSPESAPEQDLSPLFYDTNYQGDPVRAVAVRLSTADDQIDILVAETLSRRTMLTRQIMLALVVPGLVLTLVALWLLRSGIHGGLSPLSSLARQIEKRSPDDLSPIRDTGPVEVRPLTRALNDLLGKLSAAHASQRRFIANAAHQLRTPLAALQLQAERALAESNPAAHAESLQRVANGTTRIAHIARQLLTLAKAEPEANSHDRFATFDLAAVVREVASSWVPKALEQGADLGYSGSESPVWIRGDSALIAELVSNLIDNALRYGRKDGCITVAVNCADVAIQLCVEDDGPGIAPEFRQTVFDRFVRLPGSSGDGCGLGLAIVKEIARLHGGDVAITDTEGGGLRVTVSLHAASIDKLA